MSLPEVVWQTSWQLLLEDILCEEKRLLDNPEADLTDGELKNRCLQKFDKILRGYGKSFNEFSTTPKPCYGHEEVDGTNTLINEKLRYNRCNLT
ncbi:hypothetical protein P3S67_000715 [Capsicum chacoense]